MNARRFLRTLIPLTLAVVLLTGCGHTNNLAKYSVAGSTALFHASARGGSASSHVLVESPSDNAIAEVAAVVGSLMIGSEGHNRLERAIVADSVAAAVARGTQQAAVDYLSIRPVATIEENPTYIVETELTDYALVSTSLGMHVRVTGRSRMLDRATGGLVWENSETYTVALSETFLLGIAPRIARSGASIYNAVQLLRLSDEELQRVVNEGAEQAGREIGDELREDVAELHGR